MSRLVAQQGHGDGLCGIYSLLNVLAHFEGESAQNNPRQREIFGHLMLAAERLGYLDYQHIVRGFEAFEMIEIVDFVTRNFGYALKATLSVGNLPDAPAAVVYCNAQEQDHWVALVDTVPEPINSWPKGVNGKASKIGNSEALASTYGLIIEQISRD